MEILLLLCYIALLAVHLFLLRAAVRTPVRPRWLRLFLTQLLSVAAALLLANYFGDLPGTGAMPGLTYFAEAFFSLMAAALYSTGLVVSLFFLLRSRKRSK